MKKFYTKIKSDDKNSDDVIGLLFLIALVFFLLTGIGSAIYGNPDLLIACISGILCIPLIKYLPYRKKVSDKFHKFKMALQKIDKPIQNKFEKPILFTAYIILYGLFFGLLIVGILSLF